MLRGKKYPQNLRGFILLMEKVLRPLLKDGEITSHSQLMNVLEEKISRSTKLWDDVLIKPLFLYLLLIRAKPRRKAAASFGNCQKFDSTFLCSRSFELCKVIIVLSSHQWSIVRRCQHPNTLFMKGEHIIQLSATPCLGIWSDIRIEMSYNRIGKGVAGIIGQSRNMETMKVWAYSLNVSGQPLWMSCWMSWSNGKQI